MNKKYNFVYKTTHVNGKFYIGRHSTDNLEDGYFGSGGWVKSIKDKTSLTRTILIFCDSYEELLEKEYQLIEQHFHQEECMNFIVSSCGFAPGEYNINRSPERRKAISERMLTNNPMKGKNHTEEAKHKIKEATSGENNGFYGKKHDEKTIAIMKEKALARGPVSDDLRKKRSYNQKRRYELGLVPPRQCGILHSEESKIKMSQIALNRKKYKCETCEREFDAGNFKQHVNKKNKCKRKE